MKINSVSVQRSCNGVVFIMSSHTIRSLRHHHPSLIACRIEQSIPILAPLFIASSRSTMIYPLPPPPSLPSQSILYILITIVHIFIINSLSSQSLLRFFYTLLFIIITIVRVLFLNSSYLNYPNLFIIPPTDDRCSFYITSQYIIISSQHLIK